MPTYKNDNGTWREVKELYANDNGTWREIKKGYVNDNGTWRLIHNSEEAIWETSTFRLGGIKNSNTGVVPRVGWGSGNFTTYVYGSLGDELELANTTMVGQIASAGTSSFPTVVWGFTSQFYTISNTNSDFHRTQINTSNNPFPVGSIANSAFTTASSASGSNNNAGLNLNIKTLYITPSSGTAANTIILGMDTSSANIAVWPAQHIKISYPSGGFQYHYQTYFFSNLGGRTSSPVVKATKTAGLVSGNILRNDGTIETNLNGQFNGFGGQNVPIILYDRPNFGFKSSSGGVEYRTVFQLDWQVDVTSNANIKLMVDGHGLPADAWSRLEINGVSLDVSLFTKTETGGGFAPLLTNWNYTYPGNAKTAFGDIEDTVSLKLFKEP